MGEATVRVVETDPGRGISMLDLLLLLEKFGVEDSLSSNFAVLPGLDRDSNCTELLPESLTPLPPAVRAKTPRPGPNRARARDVVEPLPGGTGPARDCTSWQWIGISRLGGGVIGWSAHSDKASTTSIGF